MRKQRNVVFGALILAVLAALVLSLSACAKQKATASGAVHHRVGWGCLHHHADRCLQGDHFRRHKYLFLPL